MDYQITAMDLHFLVGELRDRLKNAKADKIFNPEKNEFVIGFHVPGVGRTFMRIKLPNYVYLTDIKGDMPDTPRDLAKVLRKYISGARLREINQFGFERIMELLFESKLGKFRLILELFSKGNIILTDENYIIKSVLFAKKWKDRTLRGNVKYEYPKRRYNPLEMKKEEFTASITESDKESIVKALALDLGLGGVYSEELCICSGIDKERKRLKSEEISKLFDELKKLRNAKLSSRVYFEDGKAVKIAPIMLKSIDMESKNFPSFNEALDYVLTFETFEKKQDEKLAPYKKEQERLKKQVREQEEQIKKLEKMSVDAQAKGEHLYNNYAEIDKLLKELNEIIKKHPQKEIREKLKGHKVIKDINFKDKTVTIEIKEK